MIGHITGTAIQLIVTPICNNLIDYSSLCTTSGVVLHEATEVIVDSLVTHSFEKALNFEFNVQVNVSNLIDNFIEISLLELGARIIGAVTVKKFFDIYNGDTNSLVVEGILGITGSYMGGVICKEFFEDNISRPNFIE